MNPFENYKNQLNNKIMMAKPEELTLMLYEGAIKFTNIAIIAIEKKDIEQAHKNILKVQDIISYLKNTLDLNYEVSKDFLTIYNYIERLLVNANMKKDIEILNEVNKHLHDIKDTWTKILKKN